MRTIEIFKLLGSIFVNNNEANNNIDETDNKAKGLGERLKNGVGTAAKWGAAITGAAAAGGAALFGMASKASDAGDRVDKMSQKIGISREAFQKYDYVLGQNGTDVEKLQVGLKTLTQRMGESADGTGKGAEAFDKLGLSAKDVTGAMKSQEQMFEETAKALMKMPEGAEKSQMAFDLFGKAGLELMPMLNAGADSFDELSQRAHDLGFVMSDEAVTAAAQFNDSMDDVKKALGGAMTKIGTEVMPIFQIMLDWILAHMPEIQVVIQKVFEYIGIFVMAVVDIFTDYLIPIFQSIFDWTKENWPLIQKIIEGVFGVIKTVWDTVLKPVLGALLDLFKGIFEWIGDNWATIQKIIEGVFNGIAFVWNNILSPVLGVLLEIIKSIVSFVGDKFGGMLTTFEKTFDGIGKAVGAVTKIFDGVVGAISKAYDWLTTWNKTDAKQKDTTVKSGGTRIDGSHAGGLDYVPFDGYTAVLHKGERVLTAEENKLGSTVNHTGTIRVEGVNSSGELNSVVDIVMEQLRREVRMA